MTYDRLKIDDEGMLDMMLAARPVRRDAVRHAENHGIIAWMGRRLLERGYMMPKYSPPAPPSGSLRRA
ncbi:MAG: hypothetical protein QM757_09420 [Paludibaculum sp.]